MTRILLCISFVITLTLAVLNRNYSNEAVFYSQVIASVVLAFALVVSFVKKSAKN